MDPLLDYPKLKYQQLKTFKWQKGIQYMNFHVLVIFIYLTKERTCIWGQRRSDWRVGRYDVKTLHMCKNWKHKKKTFRNSFWPIGIMYFRDQLRNVLHVLWEWSIRNVKQCQQQFTLQQQGCDFEITFCVKVPPIYFYR